MQRLDDARSIACFPDTKWYFPRVSILTGKNPLQRVGKEHVESTESPVNWIEQISCFRILRSVLLVLLLAVVFFSLLTLHFIASRMSMFVCVNLIVLLELQFLVIGINVWSLARMCASVFVNVVSQPLVTVTVVISNTANFFCMTIAFCMHASRHVELVFFSPFLLFNVFSCNEFRFFALFTAMQDRERIEDPVKPMEKTSNFPWTCIYWLLYTLGFTYEMCSWFAW